MNSQSPLKVVMLGPGLDVKGGISRNENLFLQHAPSEVQIKHISTKEEGTVLLKTGVFFKSLFQLVWVLLTERVDLVHIRGSHRGSAFRQAILTWLVKAFRKPTVLQTHASEFHIFYANLAPWLQKFIAWSFSQGDRFVVLSESWKKFHTTNLGLDPDKVTVMYNPVKVPPEVPIRYPSIPTKLIFLGHIGQRKGAFDLIKAFANLPEQEKNNSLLIMAGDGEVEAAKELVASFNLSDKIIFPGWIGTEERDLLLTKVDIFVLPSYNEGLPLSMLEAMAWELPVVVTPVGGIAEIVIDGENGLLVEPGNIEQLQEAIKSLIADEDLRSVIADKGRQKMKSLDIHNYWLSFLDIYYSVIKPSV